MATDMAPEAAIAALAAAAAEASPAPSRMSLVPNPGVRAEATQHSGSPAQEIDAMWSGLADKFNASLPQKRAS
jgi:hypothetical protein